MARLNAARGNDSPSDLRLFAYGVLALGSTTLLTAVLAVPTTALLVRALGTAEFGALTFALTVVGLATTVAQLGLVGGGLARMVASAQSPGAGADVARVGLAVGATGGALASATCAIVALILPEPTRSVLLASSPLPIFAVTGSILVVYLRLRQQIRVVEGSNTATQSAYYLGVILLTLTGAATAVRVAGLRVLIAAALVGAILPTWRRLTASRDRQPGRWRSLLMYSVPLLFANIAAVVMQQSDVVMLGLFRSAQAVGFYTPIAQVVGFSITIMFVLTSYFGPLASRIAAHGDMQRLTDVYITVSKWGIALCAPLLAALVVAPAPLLGLLFGDAWDTPRAALIARVLVVGYATFVVTGQNGPTLVALGASRAIAIRSAVALVANIVINCILIPSYGVLGAAIGTTTVLVGLNVATSALLLHHGNISPIRKDYLTLVAAIAVLTLASFGFVLAAGLQNSILGSLMTAAFVGAGSAGIWIVTGPPGGLGRVIRARKKLSR